MPSIVVLNYGLGNIRSVSNAVRLVGGDPVVSGDPAVIREADGLIIPGVGAFPKAMSNLDNMNLIDVVNQYIGDGRPVLGICLGMQLLFESGTEFVHTAGLGALPGLVDRLPITPEEGRLPHIAWSNVVASPVGEAGLFSGLRPEERRFYFVHSFAPTNVPDDFVVGVATYCGHKIVAAVARDNVWATQFHPEKSGPSGLRLIANFAAQC